VVDSDSDLRDLPAFVAVAETLSFRGAAGRLGVTPAAVSRTIQRLEERLGTALFRRTTRRVGLTAEGERFAVRCREALAQVALAHEEIRNAKSAPHGTLTVTASPIVAPILVPRMARFTGRYPSLRVDLRLTDVVVPLGEGGIDVAVRLGPTGDPNAVARVLMRTRWITVASPAYLARRGTPRTVDELAGHDCLRFVPPSGKPTRWTFKSGTFVAKGPFDVNAGDALLSAVVNDLGIAQIFDFMCVDELRDKRIVEVLADESVAAPRVHAVHASGTVLPRVRAFVDFLTTEIRSGP